MPAATPAEMTGLVERLRGKGLGDDDVAEALRGMGYSKADATAALGGTRSTPPAPSPAPAPAGPPAPASEPTEEPQGDGFSMPSFSPPSLSLTPPKRLNGGDLAGFFGGVIAYTLVLNYLRYGSGGVTGWLGAKFLNRPYSVNSNGTVTPSAATTSNGLTSTKSSKPKSV